MKKRAVFRIQLTNEAKDKLLGMTDKLGVTQIALTSKLCEWFAQQPATIQNAILGLYPSEIKKDVAKMLLERMAKGK